MTLRNSNVAVIGLGAMGLPIAINLGKAGLTVQAWNRSQSALDRAVAEGGVTAIKSITDIDASIVLTVLPDLPQVEEILKQGLESVLQAGDILVVMESMKLIFPLVAPRDGTIATLRCAIGDIVARGQTLVQLEPLAEPKPA